MARHVCSACEVREQCRSFARGNHEYGFWGGESEDERHAAGYRLIANDFDTRIVPLDRLDGAPDFVTTFPPGIAGYIAAHDEAIAYLEDVIADSLETLKQLKDARWMNAMELHQTAAR